MSRGLGDVYKRQTYTMQFDSYEPVPKNVAAEIISKAGGNA